MASNENINVKINVDTTNATKSTGDFRNRVRELMNSMTELQLAGKANSDEYRAMAQELGNIKDAMGDTAAQARILSDDFFKQRAAMEGLAVGVNIFSGLTQAAALCGVENEDLQKVLVKLQAAQNLANTAMNIAKALNKDTALMTALRAKSQKSLNKEINSTTAAENAGTAATATFTAAEGAATTGAITLKGAVKAVGTAIKSVPVIGWILAAVAAITTLISLISDANEEEEKGNILRDKQIYQRNKILEQQQQSLNLQRLENYDLRDKAKTLETLDKNSVDYRDNLKEIAEYTGLSKEYIESLDGAGLEKVVQQYGTLKDVQTELNNAQENYNNLIKQREEIEEKTFSEDEDERNKAIADLKWMNNEQSHYHKQLEEANEKMMTAQDTIAKKQREINKIRQSEVDFQVKSAAAEKQKQKAAEASKKAEQERLALIQQTERELSDLDKFMTEQTKTFNDVLANIDLAEVELTEMYDNALDSAIKYYGEESEQVEKITELRLKALADLDKKRDEYNKNEIRKAEDDGAAIEDSRLKGRIATLKEGTEEYKYALIEQDRLVESAELTELNRKHDDLLISEDLFQTEMDRIINEHAKARADIEEEWNQVIIENAKKRDEEIKASTEASWGAAQNIISSFGDFLDTAMNAELAMVEGNEKKEKEIRKRYARARFMSQIGSIGVSTAQAIMEAWSSVAAIMFPGNVIAGGALTSMLAATGMAQTAQAKAEMENALKAERGGILNGPSHRNGGIMLSNGVEAEGGEAIINKRSTAMFAPLLSDINSYNGYGAPLVKNTSSVNGQISMGVSEDVVQRIVSETVNGIVSIPVVVSEHRITQAQRRVDVIHKDAII